MDYHIVVILDNTHLLFYSCEGQVSEISFTGLKIKILLQLGSYLFVCLFNYCHFLAVASFSILKPVEHFETHFLEEFWDHIL